MDSNQRTGRLVGLLLLFVFVSGIVAFQLLQGPNLFAENFLVNASKNANHLIGSTVLGIFSGIASITTATLLLPIFKKHSTTFSYLYVALCIANLIAIMIDNVSVLSMLELSKLNETQGDQHTIAVVKPLVYGRHFWTHYYYLLISCFPVVTLYYLLYVSKLIPRLISIFGILAVSLMFIEMLASLFGHGISMNLLLPMGLIQLILPVWLIIKGLRPEIEKQPLSGN